jgi:hypothetical protein
MRGLASLIIALFAYSAFCAIYGPLWNDAYGKIIRAAAIMMTGAN